MSSEQFSDTPMPDVKPCPHCGEAMPATAQMCERCAEKHGIQAGLPAYKSNPLPSEKHGNDPAVSEAGWKFLGVLFIVIGVGVAIVAPGVLVIMAVVGTLALVRTLTQARGREETTVAIQPSDLHVFLCSVGIMTVVGVASVIAFCSVCFAVGCVGVGVTDKLDWAVRQEVVGGIAALIVAVWLGHRLWSRKD